MPTKKSESTPKKLEQVLKKITSSQNRLIVVIAPTSQYREVLEYSLKYLTTTQKKQGIYVSLDLPYSILTKRFGENNIKTENIFFIDCINRHSQKEPDAENCTCIKSPQSLTELSIALTTATNTGNFQFIVFDSLSTLMLYNEFKTAEKFSHFILSKIKNLDIKGVLMMLNEENAKKIIPVVSRFVDEIIELK